MSQLNQRKRPERKRHLFVTGAIIAASGCLLLVLAYGLQLDQAAVPPAILNEEANGFRAAWIQGKEFLPGAAEKHFTLRDLKGKPVVLNFWASWCISCRQEAHELEAFWQEYKDKGVMVVGVAIQDKKDAARAFAKHYGKTYVLGLDEDGNVSIDYGVSGVPETFLIDPQGVIRHKFTGPVTAEMLEEQLGKIWDGKSS